MIGERISAQITRMGTWLDGLARRWMPDPFVFALGLTALTAVAAWALTPSTPAAIVAQWQGGFWSLLGFGMQMCLILVTGHALAVSPMVARVLDRVAEWPKSASGALVTVSVGAMVTGWLHWGLGVICGAILAREVGRAARARGDAVNYALLGAAGYTGLLVWHGGLSGSAPLAVATDDHFLVDRIGTIPLGETVLSPFNLIVNAVLLVVVPLIVLGLAKAPAADGTPLPPEREDGVSASDGGGEPATPARWLGDTAWIPIPIALAGLAYLAHGGWSGTVGIGLNTVNMLFLCVGMIAHRSTRSYVAAVEDGVRSCAGIILQFPFYAGVMGIMKTSGLAVLVTEQLVRISNEHTFGLFAFVSAGLVNLFVPSGGGQWAVQGPILIDAAERLGVPVSRAILALAYGDQWTNMAQPFWALPLLGITGLRARDIMGYTITIMLLTGVVFAVALLLVSLG